MPNWADKLIQEYSDGRKELNKLLDSLDKEKPADREDRKMINSMIDDMGFTIEWLETGKQPGTYRGVDKRLAYQRNAIESMEVIPDITCQLDDINEKQLFMTSEEKIILNDILSSFSLRERQCYILHTAQGRSMGQIADEIGVSKATVQMYIKRAREKVNQRVSKAAS